MPVQFDCSCGQRVQASDDQVGRNVRCPKCLAVVVVPATALAVAVEAVGTLSPCPLCGGMIEDEATSCRHCGEKLDDSLMERDNTDSKATKEYQRGMRGLSLALLFFGFLQFVAGAVVVWVTLRGGWDPIALIVVGGIALTTVPQIVLGFLARRLYNWVNYVVAVFSGGLLALSLLSMLAQFVMGNGADGAAGLCSMVILAAFLSTAISNIRLYNRIRTHSAS